jgi:hypothetical protein
VGRQPRGRLATVKLDSRRTAFVSGILLLMLALAVAATVKDSAVSGIVSLTGCALILYAIVWDRLKEVGPGGIKFRQLRERVAKSVETKRRIADEIATITETIDAKVTRGGGQAAALIRAAQTPDELVDTLAELIAVEEPPRDDDPGSKEP